MKGRVVRETMAAEISCDLPCLFYCMEGQIEHISRNSE